MEAQETAQAVAKHKLKSLTSASVLSLWRARTLNLLSAGLPDAVAANRPDDSPGYCTRPIGTHTSPCKHGTCPMRQSNKTAISRGGV
jgi:hypothetical protein